MTVSVAEVADTVQRHHAAILDLLAVLRRSPDTARQAVRIEAAVWPVLADYGLRDVHGSVWDGRYNTAPVDQHAGRRAP